MKKMSIQLFAFAVIAFCALLLTACPQAEEAAESAGAAVEAGMDEAAAAAEDAGEMAGEAADAAGEAVEEATSEQRREAAEREQCAHRPEHAVARPVERADQGGRAHPVGESQGARRGVRRSARHADHGEALEAECVDELAHVVRSTTPQISRRCCREASSGTTPPHSRWISTCEAITLERISQDAGPASPSTATAAAVSSHEVSMPSSVV